VARLLSVLVALACATGVADAGQVSGVVTDARSGEPIAGAVVRAGDGASALTDSRGAFVIEAEPGGQLGITAAAYNRATVRLAGATVEVALEPRPVDPGEVIEIEGAEPYRGKPPTYELSPEVIRKVPGSGNDALKSLQALPGVARVPFGVGGLVLRGTSPRDSGVYIEGMEVPLLYHFAGLASFFPSTLLESLELVPGGYSAELGRGQGGVAILAWRPGRTDRWRVGSELSMIDLSIRADGPSGDRSAWSIALRRSLVDAVLPLLETDTSLTTAPRYWDGQLRYDLRPWSGGHLALLVLGSDDEVSVEYGDNQDKSFTLETRFARLGIRYDQRIGDLTELHAIPWVGVERYHLASTFQTMTTSNTPAGGRVDVKRVLPRGHIRAGIDVASGDFSVDSLTIDDVDDSEIAIGGADSYLDAGIWVEGLARFAGGRLGIKPGVRLDRFGLADQVTVDPRLVVTHELGRGVAFRESVGMFHQGPTPADSLWGNDDLESSYAIQSTLGVEVPLGERTRIGVTGFYSELYNQPVDDPDADDDALNDLDTYKIGAIASTREFLAKQFGSFSQLINTGRGRNLGAELLVRHVGERGFGWLAYTLSRSTRRDTPGGLERPYILDQRHVLTALGSLQLGDSWRIGARVRLASGNPITPVVGAEMVGPEEFEPIYGPELSERLPLFVQLDARVDREWVRDWGIIRAFVDVQNATARTNVEGRVYSDDYSSFETTKGLPVFPSFGVEYAPRDD
jgi:hypothetical protein